MGEGKAARKGKINRGKDRNRGGEKERDLQTKEKSRPLKKGVY